MDEEQKKEAMRCLWANMYPAKRDRWAEYSLTMDEIALVMDALEVAGEM